MSLYPVLIMLHIRSVRAPNGGSPPRFLITIMNDEFISDTKTISQISQQFFWPRHKRRTAIQEQGTARGYFQQFGEGGLDGREALVGGDLEFGLFHHGGGADGYKVDFDFGFGCSHGILDLVGWLVGGLVRVLGSGRVHEQERDLA